MNEDESRETKPEKMGFEGRQAQASLGDDLWELHAAAAKVTDFTAGRSLHEFEELDVLRAAVASMLRLMDAAAGRIAAQSQEIASRLEAREELHRLIDLPMADEEPDVAKTWQFVTESLPSLLASAATELEAWHEN